MNKIVIDEIDIEVLKKDVKNINLSVHSPDARVKISVPKHMNEESIRKFIISRLTWIKKQRSKYHLKDVQVDKEFLSGESHYFFDLKYILNLIETKNKAYVEVENNMYINLYVRANTIKEKREKIIKEWYRAELKALIPSYIEKWEPIMGVKVGDFGVKQMKTRWGTCNVSDKRIWINLELAKKNPKFLEYIIVHEMVHLLERKHNDIFKRYMDRFLPDWRNIKAELNGIRFD